LLNKTKFKMDLLQDNKKSDNMLTIKTFSR
jgi:hypothetical protein